MDEAVEKVLKLIQSRHITAEEGAQLLDALEVNLNLLPQGFSARESDEATIPTGSEERLHLTPDKDFSGKSTVALEGIDRVVIHFPEHMNIRLSRRDDPTTCVTVNTSVVEYLTVWKDHDVIHFYFGHNVVDETIIDVYLRIPTALPVEIIGYTPPDSVFDSMKKIYGSKSSFIKLHDITGDIVIRTKLSDTFLKNISRTHADVSTISADVEAEEVEGYLQIDTKSGDIWLRNINGEAIVKSISGNIQVEKASGTLKLSSRSGSVEITDSSGDIEAKNLSGHIGIFRVKGTLRVQGRSGDVEINSAQGRFLLETVSGDVNARLLTIEECRIQTSSGGVGMLVEKLHPDSVTDIRTNSGSIRMELPADITGALSFSTISGIIDNKAKTLEVMPQKEKSEEAVAKKVPEILLKTTTGAIKIRQ